MPAAVLPPTGKTRWPKIVSSSSTPPARPQPTFTNISAATCDVPPHVAESLDEVRTSRSAPPDPAAGDPAGGVAS